MKNISIISLISVAGFATVSASTVWETYVTSRDMRVHKPDHFPHGNIHPLRGDLIRLCDILENFEVQAEQASKGTHQWQSKKQEGYYKMKKKH